MSAMLRTFLTRLYLNSLVGGLAFLILTRGQFL